MNAAERTAALRDLFYTEPSEAVWTQILGLFEDWDYKDDLQIGIDYANSHLEGWPEALRTAPETWRRVMLGEPKYLIDRAWERGNRTHPAMQLVRTLTFPPRWRGRRGSKPHRVGIKEAKLIAKAKAISRITTLIINSHDLGDDGAYELAEARHLTALRHLGLQSNRIGPQGVWDLIEGDGKILAGLTSLDLGSNPIENEGARGLALCAELAGLQELNIGGCQVGDAGLKELALSEPLSGLRRLGLSRGHRASGGWLATVLKGRFVDGLEALDVGFCNLTDRELKTLMQCPLPSLSVLKIEGARCSPETARALTDWLAAQKLDHVDARYAGPEVRSAVMSAVPDPEKRVVSDE